MEPETYQPGIATKYILEFYPQHTISEAGGIQITVPPQVIFSKDVEVKVEASVTGKFVDNDQLEWTVIESARAIVVSNIIQSGEGALEPNPDTVIKLIVAGLDTPYTNEQTDSFAMASFNLIAN